MFLLCFLLRLLFFEKPTKSQPHYLPRLSHTCFPEQHAGHLAGEPGKMCNHLGGPAIHLSTFIVLKHVFFLEVLPFFSFLFWDAYPYSVVIG